MAENAIINGPRVLLRSEVIATNNVDMEPSINGGTDNSCDITTEDFF